MKRVTPFCIKSILVFLTYIYIHFFVWSNISFERKNFIFYGFLDLIHHQKSVYWTNIKRKYFSTLIFKQFTVQKLQCWLYQCIFYNFFFTNGKKSIFHVCWEKKKKQYECVWRYPISSFLVPKIDLWWFITSENQKNSKIVIQKNS